MPAAAARAARSPSSGTRLSIGAFQPGDAPVGGMPNVAEAAICPHVYAPPYGGPYMLACGVPSTPPCASPPPAYAGAHGCDEAVLPSTFGEVYTS